MYIKRNTKYFSYIYFIDIASISIAFVLASLLYLKNLPLDASYAGFFLVIIAGGVLVNSLTDNLNGFFARGYYAELICVVKWWCFVLLIVFFYLFATKTTEIYSRVFFALFIIIGFSLMIFMRIYFKYVFMKRYRKSKSGTKIAIVTTLDRLSDITSDILKQKSRDFYVSNIILVDNNYMGKNVNGFDITANTDNMFDILSGEVLDEVFINVGSNYPELDDIINNFQSMGITIHLSLENLGIPLTNVRSETFIGYPVLTSSNNEISHAKLLQKRVVDIVGSIVGLLFTLIISVFLIPIISIESKGSPFYGQTRVGRNGRRFTMYKFRSMYKDADARKAQLMESNKMQGLMFKMDDDPRITKVGKFIRKTSLDEFPQFWNVLKGEMSLVGTRPPTLDEFAKYSLRHKSRLSFKPGITGLWQVSGRSDITDFEDVVDLDRTYIKNWSMSLDFKILVETVVKICGGKGAA